MIWIMFFKHHSVFVCVEKSLWDDMGRRTERRLFNSPGDRWWYDDLDWEGVNGDS